MDIEQEIENIHIYLNSIDNQIEDLRKDIKKIKNNPILSEEDLEKLKNLLMTYRLERIGNTKIYLFDNETIKEIKKILNLP